MKEHHCTVIEDAVNEIERYIRYLRDNYSLFENLNFDCNEKVFDYAVFNSGDNATIDNGNLFDS